MTDQIQFNIWLNQFLDFHTLLSTPIIISTCRLSHWLCGYDKNEPSYLIAGFENGFSLEFVGESPGIESKNVYSAYNKPQINDNKIK